MSEFVQYGNLLNEIKNRIRQAQIKAVLSVNAEMIRMYWDIGHMIDERQKAEGWGAGVIPRLAKDIQNDLSEVKGFSERNIKRMLAFYREYPSLEFMPQLVAQLMTDHSIEKMQQPVAQLDNSKQLVFQIPWGHNIILIEKIKDQTIRFWYMEQIIQNGWSRDVLGLMIKNSVHTRQGNLISNFEVTLPNPQSDLVQQTLKDPYIFDFLTLTEPFQEQELEIELVKHLEKFLVELGAGFAFMGRQYHLTVSNKDFYLDLLFYHIKLRCFVIIGLKKGEFKPEYAGKMNFYCSAVDDRLKHENDQSTIGLILCQTKNKIFAEYALRDIHKPIGISEYELTRVLPDNLKSNLPSVEEIEAELSRELGDE